MKCNAYGTERGHRLHLFECTNKIIVSMKDCNDVVQAEMLRAKNLPGNSKLQVASTRPPDVIYHDDQITLLKGVEKVKATKLGSSNMLSIDDLLHSTHPPSTLGLKLWNKMIQQASSVTSTPTPTLIDHRKAENPLESLHRDDWDDNIKKPTASLVACNTKK